MKNKIKTKEINEIYNNLPNFFQIIDDTSYYDLAMEEFIKYDSTISFFDAMYVALMKKEDIQNIVSFDSDFDKVNEIIRFH